MANIPSVFVSSTFTDLEKERERVAEALLKIGCFPNGMKLFKGPHRPVWTKVAKAIDESDYYLLILAGRYGTTDDDGVGFTEKEFDYAVKQGKTAFVFLHKNPEKLSLRDSEQTEEGRKRLATFREKIKQNWCYQWKKSADLIAGVMTLMDEVRISPDKSTEKIEVVTAEEHKNREEDAPSAKSRDFRTSRPEKRTSTGFRNNRYDQFFIDDLKSRADLVRMIEPYAPLKKKGANWMGCCPFHQEKTPSFSVSPAKGFYKCFGCGKGGNAYTFLMEMEGLNFPEAIQRVAEMTGVPLPEPIDDQQYAQSKKRKEEKKQLSEQVIELNKLALEFWEAELQSKDKKARAARKYLQGRGISEEIQKQFRIGFSPDSWDGLLNFLREKGHDDKLIEQSGLVSVNEEKDRVFDRFRGRIMFPVLDINGSPVAFGARAMGDDQPKYLNSPETPAYVKGQHLYGLFQSKEAIRQKKFAILVEGYLDLIALSQFGITNVAASLGTAFTPEQSKLLSRFTKKIVINYDGDSAGIKAARRAIEELLPNDFEVKVLVLPNGQDPDDFVRANGTEAYNEARGKSVTYLNFTLDAAASGRSLANPRQKAEAIEDVMPVLSAIKNPIQKRESFDQSMDFFRVEDQGLKRDLWNTVKGGHRTDPAQVKKQARRAAQVKITVAEHTLLELLAHDAELREKILPLLEESDYDLLATAPIFRAMYALAEKNEPLTLESLIDNTDDDELAEDFVPLMMLGESKRGEGEVLDNVIHDAENCILSLRSMAIQTRLHDVSQELLAAEQVGDSGVVNQLVSEHLELSKMKQSLLSKIREN